MNYIHFYFLNIISNEKLPLWRLLAANMNFSLSSRTIWHHRAQKQCQVNVILPHPCIIATSGMGPALSSPIKNIHTHSEAEGTAKQLITGAFNAKKASQWILHFENFLPDSANFVKCTTKDTKATVFKHRVLNFTIA